MITQEDAENLARKHVTDYVNSCNCDTNEDAANVLMKLLSVCGVSMVALVGYSDAVDRMQGTTDFIAEKLSNFEFKCERQQFKTDA